MSPLSRSAGDHDRPERSQRPLEPLLADLAGGEPEARRAAVQALADRPDALPALVHRVGIETDPGVRNALCTQLARHDRPEVVDGLLPHLASDDAALRNAVTQVLSMLPVSCALRVPQLLADPDPDVRILTVMTLGGLRLDQVEDWLTQLVRDDTDPRVVGAAMAELAELAGARGAPVLEAAGHRFPADPFIQFIATQSRARMDSART